MIPFVVPPLSGLQILVTRPALQADGLCQRIVALGGGVLRLPTLSIAPNHFEAASEPFDLLIFISTNAVQYGQALIAMQPQARLAAVGAATAQALLSLGHAIDVMPQHSTSSEALLAHPLLQSPPARILIVRGVGGRELLHDTLTTRGSEVTIAEVYQRQVVQPEAAQLQAVQARLQAGDLDLISATSVQLLQALHDLLDEDLRALAQRCALLVGSARIATVARALGWSGECIIADSPEDAAMIAALTRWHTRARSELLR